MRARSSKFRIHNPSTLPLLPNNSFSEQTEKRVHRTKVEKKIQKQKEKSVDKDSDFCVSVDSQCSMPESPKKPKKKSMLRRKSELIKRTCTELESFYGSSEIPIEAMIRVSSPVDTKNNQNIVRTKESFLSSFFNSSSPPEATLRKNVESEDRILYPLMSCSTQDSLGEKIEERSEAIFDKTQKIHQDMERYSSIFESLLQRFESANEWLNIKELEKTITSKHRPLTIDDFQVLLHYAKNCFDHRWTYNPVSYSSDMLEIRKCLGEKEKTFTTTLPRVDRFKRLMSQDFNKFLLDRKEKKPEKVEEAPRASEQQISFLNNMLAERKKSPAIVLREDKVLLVEPEFAFYRVHLVPPFVSSEVD